MNSRLAFKTSVGRLNPTTQQTASSIRRYLKPDFRCPRCKRRSSWATAKTRYLKRCPRLEPAPNPLSLPLLPLLRPSILSLVTGDIKMPLGKKKSAVVPHITYPGLGVNVSALAPAAPGHLAVAARSPVSARSSFDTQLVPREVLGKTLRAESPLIQLRHVTELYPKSTVMTAGKPYTAWVITYPNTTEVGMGPVPASDSGCKFVGIMDASTG